jgi:hypothetical protein
MAQPTGKSTDPCFLSLTDQAQATIPIAW